EWVTENSAALADTPTAPVLIEAEDVALRSGIPASVVRLGGIYGPGRTRLIEQVRNGLHVPDQPVQYTNRIHRDDAAGLLAHLLLQADKRELLAPCYLGVDDEPAPLHEVAQWLAQRLGVALLDEGATANRVGSKRCSNALARESGWVPQYQGEREGYACERGKEAEGKRRAGRCRRAGRARPPVTAEDQGAVHFDRHALGQRGHADGGAGGIGLFEVASHDLVDLGEVVQV